MNTLGTMHKLSQESQYHPHYFAAILSTQTARSQNAMRSDQSQWHIPAISFTTPDSIRISMTLNGMRMATEFFASGSQRVLVLIEQRLKAKQFDVVHDVLVYLWERVLLMRASAQEAKDLQAESLAAYLGIRPCCVRSMFNVSPICAKQIAQRIRNGEAGKIQRNLDISLLTENLLARLEPELKEFKHNEERIQFLIEEIASSLYL